MATQRFIMQRDTGSWRLQIWASFALAMLTCAIGILWLPGQQLDRAFLAIGMFFCLFATFSLAKTIRDNRDGEIDTKGWVIMVWCGFGAAFCLTGWGLWRMDIEAWQKGYMVVSWLFLVSSTFSVAKTIRDHHEANLMDRSSRSVSTD